ncbi:hypothetical protein JTB14_021300 [Gonioctena quinquepunctata]|nr:hypothetical protein JTB14_021300 [Gonioctena quinquepunctata]
MARKYVRKTARAQSYSKDDLTNAIRRILAGELTLYRAVQLYRIPKSTLFNRVKGNRAYRRWQAHVQEKRLREVEQVEQLNIVETPERPRSPNESAELERSTPMQSTSSSAQDVASDKNIPSSGTLVPVESDAPSPSCSSVSFEDILLGQVKHKSSVIKQKRTRVGTGAVVLTSMEVIERLDQRNNKMKLKKKDINKKKQIQPKKKTAKKTLQLKKLFLIGQVLTKMVPYYYYMNQTVIMKI